MHQSRRTRYTGHITKAGRSMLRLILIQVHSVVALLEALVAYETSYRQLRPLSS
ncbi:MAG: hypothetical protein H5U00_07705 [Clostridia bacterium]|nr:hypothetical protein [Clostridia bacterium]